MMRKIVSYSLYPTLLASVAAITGSAIFFQWDYKAVYGAVTIGLVLTLMLLERMFPLADEWSMTGRSFLRDLKYIALDAPVITVTRTAAGLMGIYYAQHHRGLLSEFPFVVSAAGFLLVFEFFQYWYHRFSHSGKGSVGAFLWRVHVAHHLPDRVYVVMHAVFHPINAFVSALIVQIPLIVLGVSPEAAFIATMLIDLQSLVSHVNIDIRAGFFNYLFVGAETHRYHHSANPVPSNFGNTLAIWDILFGTFVYRPGIQPERLGVSEPEEYPDSNDLFRVLLAPFRSAPGIGQVESRRVIS